MASEDALDISALGSDLLHWQMQQTADALHTAVWEAAQSTLFAKGIWRSADCSTEYKTQLALTPAAQQPAGW